LVPLGAVPPELVEDLVAYFDAQYRLNLLVAQPQPIPGDLVNGGREQIEAHDLVIQTQLNLSTKVSLDPEAVIIGLTGADLYTKDENWRYAFGVRGNYAEPVSVLSLCRMYLGGEDLASDLVVFRRATKMLSRYIGFLYYGLKPNDDPASPMYRSILSVGDLDRIHKPLPLSGTPASQ
jgi:predicted Zn-dependent protease